MKKLNFILLSIIFTNNYCVVERVILDNKAELKEMEVIDPIYSQRPLLSKHPNTFWIAKTAYKCVSNDSEISEDSYVFDEYGDATQLIRLFGEKNIKWFCIPKNRYKLDKGHHRSMIKKDTSIEEDWQEIEGWIEKSYSN